MNKIAIISDIHFGKDARNTEMSVPNAKFNGKTENAPSLCDGAIGIIKKMGVDYLFVTGDLTSVGSPEEFFYCEQMIYDIAEKAGIPSEKVIWCSGNHDNDWSITEIYRSKYRDSHDLIQDIAKKQYERMASMVSEINMHNKPLFKKKGPLPLSGIFEDDNMIVFVLNSSSTCVGPNQVEHGELTAEQIDWLREQLEQYKDETKWKIVMMHHHPFNYPFPSLDLDISQLEEGSELQELVGKYGVNLVVHGHRHHPRCKTQMENEWVSPVTFLCSGSFSVGETQRSKGDIPNCFHIIELKDSVGDLILYSYEYSVGSGWVEIVNNREVVPLDKEMHFGRIFSEHDFKKAIDNLFDFTEDVKVWKWSQLEEPLIYRSAKSLEGYINETDWVEKFDVIIKPLCGITIMKKEERI